MSFFNSDAISRTLSGRWIKRPDDASFAEPLDGVGIDTRADLRNRAFFAIHGDRHDGHTFLPDAIERGARLLIIDDERAAQNLPASSLPNDLGVLLVADTRRALGQLARAYRRTFTITKVLAITGSAGKTTTKRLLHAVLSEQLTGSAAPQSFNNDIGVPLTLLAASPRDQYIVLEIGTNAPGEIHHLGSIAEPDLVIITNIGRSHLERLGTVEDVAKEKASLLAHLRPHGTAILNADAPLLRPYAGFAKTTLLFGESDDGNLRLTNCERDENRWRFQINDRSAFHLHLPGRHNALNALAVVAAARRFGLDDQTIQRGFDAVRADAMRAVWQRIGPFDVFNDAYNANPDSVAAALATFAELAADSPRRVLVLGDMLELGEDATSLHRAVGKQIAKLDSSIGIDLVVLIGELMSDVFAVLKDHWGDASRITATSLLGPDRIEQIITLLQPGDAVLIKGSRGMALERFADALARSNPRSIRAAGDAPVIESSS